MFRWCKWCCASLIALILFISPLFAESAPSRSKLTLKESVYNFGTVVEGATISHDFSIGNSGTSDLIIERVIAGCGCTATALTTTTIKPGEEGQIRVSMDSRGMSGRISKAVRIYTNDPDNSMSVVSVAGDIDPEVRIEPANLFFDRYVKLSDGNAPSQEVSIKVSSASKTKIKSVKSYSKFIKVQEKSKSENERKVMIAIDPAIPIGEFRDRVVVELEGSDKKAINIPVFASVKGPIQVEPSAVSFGIIMGEKALVKRVKLESLEKSKFSVLDVTSSDPAVTTRILPNKDGMSYWIEVSVDPKMITQDLKASITIKGDGILSEPLSLNVYGVLPPKL